MIKLIATDIDGTLVKDGTLQIDAKYMTVIDQLVRNTLCCLFGTAVCQRTEAVCSHPGGTSLYYKRRNGCPDSERDTAGIHDAG